MNQFVHSGHCVKLIVLSNGLLLKDRLYQTVDLCVLPRKYKLDFSVLRRLRREIKTGKYNAVISPVVIYQNLATIFNQRKIPTIYSIHSTLSRKKSDTFFQLLTFKVKRKNEIFLSSIDVQTKYLINACKLSQNF